MDNTSSNASWKETFHVVWPLFLSYIPIGLACGVALHAGGFNPLLSGLASLVIFSGGGQFLMAQMLSVHAPILTMTLMILFLELRYALLGSSLSKYLKGEKKSFLVSFAFSMNDENYAVNYLKFATDKNWTPKDARKVEHWSLLSWLTSNVVGSFIGSALKIDLTLIDFALTAMFIYMIVMQIKSRLALLVSLSSGGLTILFLMLTKSTFGLIIATLSASFIGFAVEEFIKKKSNKNYLLKPFKNN